MSKEIDHEYTSNVVCPYCGYEDRDSWEYQCESDVDVEVTCGRCDKDFTFIKSISVTYSSFKKEEA